MAQKIIYVLTSRDPYDYDLGYFIDSVFDDYDLAKDALKQANDKAASDEYELKRYVLNDFDPSDIT